MSVLASAAPALGLDVADLVPAEAAALISVSDARVEFRHPLARSAVYGDAPPDRRREVHRALASALPDADADRRAWHLALAAFGPDEAASSALEQAGLRARQRSAYDVSSRAFERGARLAPDEVTQGRLLYAAADAAWLGGLADRAAALLDEARQRASARDLAISIEHLRGHIAARRGPIDEAQQILLAAAEQAAPADPGRAVVMLAEAVNASFYAGDAAAMRHAAERIAALHPGGPGRPDGVLRAERAGHGADLLGRGRARCGRDPRVGRGARAFRRAPATIPASSPGRPWDRPGSGRRTSGGRSPTGRSRSPAAARAVGVLPFVLTHVAIDQAATDRWAEAQASFHEGNHPRPGDRPAHRTGLLAGRAWRGWKRGRAGPTRAACTPPRRSTCPASSASASARSGRSPRWAISSSARPPGAGPRPLRGAAGRAPLAWHRRR